MNQHGHKPESAEFRTRDASAWQPISTAPKDGSYIDLWVLGLEEEFRFENAHYGIEHHDCGEYGRYCDSCPAPGKRWIDAFGMEIAGTVTHWRAIPASPKAEAEQRRKDAEGAEPSAWRWRAKVYKGDQYGPWILVDHDPTPNLERNFYDIYEVERLYLRPANVAALEARLKELEGEMERRIAEAVAEERERIGARVKEAASSVMGISTDVMQGDNLAITICSLFENALCLHDPECWHPRVMKAHDEIEAAIVAHMAAAIREGGE